MSKIARYQGNVRAFASDAQGMERTVFGGTNQADDLTSQITASFLRGWGIVGASEHPSLEDFNAAMYAMSQFIAYQHQMGVPEWHAEQEYHIGSICTHNGESYQSLQNANIGSQPPSAKWTPVLTSKNGLANLGLGAGSPPIGIPFYWPLAAMPNTIMPEWSNMIFLKTNNTSFSAAEYPKLALMWPGLFIPDMRGEFIRIFDDGRGVNPIQPLLGWADSRLKEHTHVLPTGRMAVGVDDVSSTWVAVENDVATPKISTKTQSGGAGETAPRSIAFNCLVRAK